MSDLRTEHIEFNSNNFDTIKRRIEDIKSRLKEIHRQELELTRETKSLNIELMGTEELINRTKRQNPEQFLIIECPVCNGMGNELKSHSGDPNIMGSYSQTCHNCNGKGQVVDLEFIEKNKFINMTIIPNGSVYAYCLDNNGRKVHIYDIQARETICKSKNHKFKIVEESKDQCSVCKREFDKLRIDLGSLENLAEILHK